MAGTPVVVRLRIEIFPCRTPRVEIVYNTQCMIEMYERNLPPYLAHDLEAWKKGVEEKSRFLDCLWGELYGSINIAEINDNAITHEQAQYLRDKYLWGKNA